MRYDIRSTFLYRYGMPSDHARTLVRLIPSDVPQRQTVGARILDVSPTPSERRDSVDFFGNAMSMLAFHDPIDSIELTVRARAERHTPPPRLDLSPQLKRLATDIATHRAIGPRSPHHFMGPSTRILPDPAIDGFARDVASPDLTAMQVLERIGETLHAEMQFESNATDVNTPPAEAFANRHGVCQDFSHIMITALRAIGVPAGYVSGFLRTIPPEGQERLEGSDAMHAWVTAWCGAEVGWVDYDPTNAIRVAQDHITVAHGSDYSDIAPVRGTLRTVGPQESGHSVDVIPLSD